MAKIGKTPHSGNELPADKAPLSKGAGGPVSAPKDAPPPAGSFGYSFSLLKASMESNFPESISGFAGSFNSETANLELRTAIFPHCPHWAEFIVRCSACGREPGNNLRLLTGRGDGVDSGINYWAESREFENRQNDLIASVYLFDENIAFSKALVENDWSEPEQLFFRSSAGFVRTMGSIAGEISTDADGFWIGDRSAEAGSAHAVIDHWGSANNTYLVLCFHEPVDSKMMHYSQGGIEPLRNSDGSLKTPLRPRLMLVVEREFARKTFGEFSDFLEVDWDEQAVLWQNMIVAGSAQSNGISSIKNAGIYWANVLAYQLRNYGESFLTEKYRRQALGFYLQAVLLGDNSSVDQCKSLLNTIASPQGALEESEAALRARAQNFDQRARDSVLSLL